MLSLTRRCVRARASRTCSRSFDWGLFLWQVFPRLSVELFFFCCFFFFTPSARRQRFISDQEEEAPQGVAPACWGFFVKGRLALCLQPPRAWLSAGSSADGRILAECARLRALVFLLAKADIEFSSDVWFPNVVQLFSIDTDINRYQNMLL